MRIGILGGGQLGRMLALKGAELGYEMHVFSEHASDPAALVTRFWHQGVVGRSPASAAALAAFFRNVDVVTFESEFLSPDPLLTATQSTRIPVRPSVEVMAQLRERSTQKVLLEKHKVTAAETVLPKNASELHEFFARVRAKKSPGIVGKQRLFGYDGYGTFILQTPAQVDGFLRDQESHLDQFIFEPMVKFKRELAISVVRDINGNVTFLPLVEWKARDKKCHWVKGPVKHKALTALKKSLKQFVTKIDYCGLITFELFDLGNKLIVNEVAPRVHNSAHYSLNALTHDQFQMHLLAISTGELKTDPKLIAGGFAMANLTGTGEMTPQLDYKTDAFLHWYGKNQNRAGRKMGHLNTVGKTADEALRLALREEKRFKL
jgi:5-(carboxyamino)imidazole ribonucleotide synthase